MLLAIALFGLIVPNGLFLYWMFAEFNGWGPVLDNHLALAFIIDAAMATALLAFIIARTPTRRVKWPTFVLLSLLGGLGFSIPFCWWLETRESPAPART